MSEQQSVTSQSSEQNQKEDSATQSQINRKRKFKHHKTAYDGLKVETLRSLLKEKKEALVPSRMPKGVCIALLSYFDAKKQRDEKKAKRAEDEASKVLVQLSKV